MAVMVPATPGFGLETAASRAHWQSASTPSNTGPGNDRMCMFLTLKIMPPGQSRVAGVEFVERLPVGRDDWFGNSVFGRDKYHPAHPTNMSVDRSQMMIRITSAILSMDRNAANISDLVSIWL